MLMGRSVDPPPNRETTWPPEGPHTPEVLTPIFIRLCHHLLVHILHPRLKKCIAVFFPRRLRAKTRNRCEPLLASVLCKSAHRIVPLPASDSQGAVKIQTWLLGEHGSGGDVSDSVGHFFKYPFRLNKHAVGACVGTFFTLVLHGDHCMKMHGMVSASSNFAARPHVL